VVGKVGGIAANERRMQSKQNVSLYSHFTLTSLLHPAALPVAVALLTAEDVAADALVEHAERVGHEVADVRQVQEGQRNAKQCVDNRYNAAQCRLGCNVTVT